VSGDGHRVRFFLINRYDETNVKMGVVFDACMICGDEGYIQVGNEVFFMLVVCACLFLPSGKLVAATRSRLSTRLRMVTSSLPKPRLRLVLPIFLRWLS